MSEDNIEKGVVVNVPPPGKANMVFLVAGFLFLVMALGLYGFGGFILYQVFEMSHSVGLLTDVSLLNTDQAPLEMSSRETHSFYGTLISRFMAPILVFFSAIVCTIVGVRLLKSAGVVTQEVISARDFAVIGPALRTGNDKAISEYIRLRSLSGVPGTFTKIGLTGLPLATIVLTIFLAVIGVFHEKFFDLAQLTLGAFIGSYVQKKGDEDQGLTDKKLGS